MDLVHNALNEEKWCFRLDGHWVRESFLYQYGADCIESVINHLKKNDEHYNRRWRTEYSIVGRQVIRISHFEENGRSVSEVYMWRKPTKLGTGVVI